MIDAAGIDHPLLALATVLVVAALLAGGSIVAGWPWLKHFALAHPSPRSSHKAPTPQGGGIAVVIAAIAVAWMTIVFFPALLRGEPGQFVALTAAVGLLALLGGVDDVRALPALPRLILQCVAVGAMIATLPRDFQLLPVIPWWIERMAFVLAGVWFVNLTNFMDGIDWMTVAETVPLTGTILLLGLLGAVPMLPTLVATALLGAMLGFAPFNRPTAKLFLGDVGSLPIGLLIGWLLLHLAVAGHLAAALILPLYYLADTTVTLLRRVARSEPFWQAHRSHYYQRAIDGGFTVPGVVTRVFAVNLALALLALVTTVAKSVAVDWAALAAAMAVVGWLLRVFARGRR